MTLLDVLTSEIEIVVVGLSGRYDDAMADFEVAEQLDVQPFESTFSAYRYLETLDPASWEFKAVICDADLLSREGYLFVHNLRREPKFRDIPVIAIDRTGKHYGPTVLKNGVDDIYTAPVSWRNVRTRIKQIRELRSMLRESSIEDPEFVEAYSIPAGKRIFDIAFASLVILALSLPMAAIALAVKLSSPGPVIYRSRRIGSGYREFDFLKFRSMVVNADHLVDQLRSQNQYGADGAFFKMKDDPRVTWVGKILRNTSLDELPQLFNVLRGDMSIVGNRPLPLKEAECLTSEEWAERFLAPAGITGKWQTSGRGKDTMDVESRISLDIQYARTYSPWEDLKILIKTIRAMKQDANV